MNFEIKAELVKFLNDTPAYGAILLTKLTNPDLEFYNDLEKWAYSHGWAVILLYRLFVIAHDIHKRLKVEVLWYNESGEVVMMSGYKKLYLQLKNLFK
jgi:hypothetical protein